MQKVLVVIDMQNDFVDGALGSSQAQLIVDNVRKKIEALMALLSLRVTRMIEITWNTKKESFYQCHIALKIPRAGILWTA